jgi:VanZ family protein
LTPLAAFAFQRATIVSVFFGLMGFNACIELSQAFLGLGRQPDVADWIAGVLATLPVLGVIGVARFIRARPIKG